MTSVLQTEKLSVAYGGVKALSDVDLSVSEGELVGLIGPNGAGKTTFIDAVTGFTPSTGSVSVDGLDLTGLRPHERALRGVARTWQAADLFDDLTVRENLHVAAGGGSAWSNAKEILRGRVRHVDAVDEALETLGLTDKAAALPTELGQGTRKLVGVARALVASPRVLLLDEPAAGFDTGESRVLGSRLRGLVDRGMSMLLIDHDMGLVLSVCDTVVVVEFGRVIARGTPETVRSDPAVIEAYLGQSGQQELEEAIEQDG
jgi:branched-chain amino acid transport system ATP-binding protein